MQKTFYYFFRFLAPYKKYAIGALFFQTLAIIAGFIIVPVLMKEVIDLFIEAEKSGNRKIWNEFSYWWGIIISINIFAFLIFNRIFDFLWTYSELGITKECQKIATKKIFQQELNYFQEISPGKIVAKFNRFQNGCQQMNEIMMETFWRNFIQFLASSLIVFYFLPNIGIIMFTWILLFISITYFVIKKYQIPKFKEVGIYESKLSGFLSDRVLNIISVKSNGKNQQEQEKIQEKINDFQDKRKKAWLFWCYTNFFKVIAITILEIIIFYLLYIGWEKGQISVGTIVMVQSYLIQIYMNVWMLSETMSRFSQAVGDTHEMIELIERKPQILSPKNPTTFSQKTGDIEFKNINFSYEKNQEKIFKNLNLKIKSGQKIGLVGHSGTGKSTLAKLILRFLDPQSGQIKIHGKNISEVSLGDLRSQISFIPQMPELFHTTIKENITYGTSFPPDKGEIEELLNHAIKNSHTQEFIQKLPETLETIVGERGVKLSGGQKQRIALARAIYKNAPILILDEATSALDSESESLIQESLESVMKNKTVLVIAHRLSTLKKMDEIWVMDQGEIIEKGSFKNLLEKKSGKFADLWKKQVEGFL